MQRALHYQIGDDRRPDHGNNNYYNKDRDDSSCLFIIEIHMMYLLLSSIITHFLYSILFAVLLQELNASFSARIVDRRQRSLMEV